MSERVVIDGRFLAQPVTGVQKVGIEFCLALDHLLAEGKLPEADVRVAVPGHARLVTSPRWKCIRLVRAGRLSGHLWEQFELPFIARGAKLLALGNTAPLASLIFSAHSTYVMVHDLSYRYFPTAYGRAFRLFYELVIPVVLQRARRVFTVSESERSAILHEYPRKMEKSRIVAVQNGGAVVPADAIPGRRSRGRNCLCVGSLTKRKNAEGLVAAAIRLVGRHDATFTFVGSTSAHFEGVRVDIPVDAARSIRFLGQIDNPELLAYEYSKAAVFVFPSFYEASPLPPIEAMAHGCPVVASAIPSLQERCGDAAVYCDPYAIETIVAATASLLDSDELWNHQQRAGLSRCGEFSWEAQAQRIFAEVLQEGQRDDS
ncbi:glycosyltransferase family 4 protein [Propionibacterium sp.]|uniref:glycosyltransferase family 4 protein n=1 Tax=Propionibacterium sp. TaxID=1977903 RepID=UPI0039E72FE9